MATIVISGPGRLEGDVKISSSKNAILPILAASLLTKEACRIENVPYLTDVGTMLSMFRELGARFQFTGDTLEICSENLTSLSADYEWTHKMRASVLVMGPLLARFGSVRLALPGGCAIGTRPIDMHIKGLLKMGARIEQGEGFIKADCGRLTGTEIYLDIPSVGATENLMMAATLASGQTTIENAAKEPEIIDLAAYLRKMGAIISGEGTDAILIEGVKRLNGVSHTPIPDRIEAATFLIAAASTNGNILVRNAASGHLRAVIAKLRQCGAQIFEYPGGIRVKGGKIQPTYIRTLSYPGFPTDVQAQMMAMLSVAGGTSVVNETIFENRFMHVTELRRMGANIRVEDRTAIITGVDELFAAEVNATDLRAGAAMVIAGLIAHGQTQIHDPHHIDRGYDRLCDKMRSLGALITREGDATEPTMDVMPQKQAL